MLGFYDVQSEGSSNFGDGNIDSEPLDISCRYIKLNLLLSSESQHHYNSGGAYSTHQDNVSSLQELSNYSHSPYLSLQYCSFILPEVSIVALQAMIESTFRHWIGDHFYWSFYQTFYIYVSLFLALQPMEQYISTNMLNISIKSHFKPLLPAAEQCQFLILSSIYRIKVPHSQNILLIIYLKPFQGIHPMRNTKGAECTPCRVSNVHFQEECRHH